MPHNLLSSKCEGEVVWADWYFGVKNYIKVKKGIFYEVSKIILETGSELF